MRSLNCAISALAFVSSVGFSYTASADTVTGFIYNNQVFEQITNNAPTSPAFYFFSIGATYETPGAFTTASATYPGSAAPTSLPSSGSLGFNYNSATYATPSALQAAYPFGDYTISLSGGTAAAATSVVPYSANYFTSSTPYVSNYTSLSNFNPGKNFTVDFNSFTPDANASQGFTFFTVYNATTGAIVYDADFQDPSTMSDLIPANTLMANTQYDYQLDFSDRLNGFDTADSSFTVQGFDVRTEGSFTTGAVTAVPEASTWTMVLLGFAGLGVAASRKSKRSVAMTIA